MDATRVWRLVGAVMNYPWGSTTAIPQLLGKPPTGAPQAELWFGAHPDAPSVVWDERGPRIFLDAWIRSDPEAVLGAQVARSFGGELPFLFKLLAAAEPLSLQAHPSRAQAQAGFARENAAGVPLAARERCYRDPHPKPELICALTPFRALNRFREPAEIERRIAALALPELDSVLAPLRERPDRSGLQAFFAGWMDLECAARARIVERAAARADALAGGGSEYAEVVRLARRYPGDPGVLAPLFLNLVELAPGEAMFLPAGELHSYSEGLGLEIMANSNNVLRGGLTSKHVDVPELLRTLSFESAPVERLRPHEVAPGEGRYAAPAAEFALSVVHVSPDRPWVSARERGVEILLCTEGRGRIAGLDDGAIERGDCFVAPAAARSYTVAGSLTLYRASASPTVESS